MAAALCKREFEHLNRIKGFNGKEIQPEREVENPSMQRCWKST